MCYYPMSGAVKRARFCQNVSCLPRGLGLHPSGSSCHWQHSILTYESMNPQPSRIPNALSFGLSFPISALRKCIEQGAKRECRERPPFHVKRRALSSLSDPLSHHPLHPTSPTRSPALIDWLIAVRPWKNANIYRSRKKANHWRVSTVCHLPALSVLFVLHYSPLLPIPSQSLADHTTLPHQQEWRLGLARGPCPRAPRSLTLKAQLPPRA